MSSCAELADYEWLTGAAAAGFLRELAGSNAPLHTQASRLRRNLSANRVHLLLEQTDLRKRAATKFDRAAEMFFTPLGLEQATDQWIGAWKALRFADGGPTADLCCGIGGDLVQLGGVTEAKGVDRDPIAACIAAANARVHGVDARLETKDVDPESIIGFAAWHIDPDRRPMGQRTTSLEWSSPNLTEIEKLLGAAPHAAIKLAPAAEIPYGWQERCQLEWISRDRECRQLVAWHGKFARAPGKRCATVLPSDGNVYSIFGSGNEPTRFIDSLDRYLFEPDAAVLAARLLGVVAAEHSLSQFTAGVAYLTGPVAIAEPFLSCFEITDTLPLDTRFVRSYLREKNIGRVEIKKRGVDVEPDVFRKQLNLVGDVAATLILTKVKNKHLVIVAKRIDPSSIPATAPRIPPLTYIS